MDIKPLTAIEARVLGSLIEKELTTPEYYPLTLNSLMAACAQKSNREPVMSFNDTDLVRALDSLREQKLAWEHSSSGSRAPKYRHGATDTMKLTQPQLAILCELLVRGPQTPGELKVHASRMSEFATTDQVLLVLGELLQRVDGPLAVKLPREPGKREERYAHLLSGPVSVESSYQVAPEPARLVVAAENERITKLETDVLSLRDELTAIRAELADFKSQFK